MHNPDVRAIRDAITLHQIDGDAPLGMPVDEFDPALRELVELMIETQELVLHFDEPDQSCARRRFVTWPRYGNAIRFWSDDRLHAEAEAGDPGARREVMTELHRRALHRLEIATDIVADASAEVRDAWLVNPEVGAEVKWAIRQADRAKQLGTARR